MKSKYLICTISLVFVLVVNSCSDKYPQGKVLYEYHCANCHMSDGKGLASLYPPLDGADYLENNLDKLACIIKYGLDDTIVVNGNVFDQPMEGIQRLNEVEINNIINYILNAWSNDLGSVSVVDTKLILENCN
jgi:mono/diheme cytochrome c family protein